MGFFGVIKCAFKFGIYAFIISYLFTILPGIPPHEMQFTAYWLPPTRKLEGPLAPNRKLDGAEKLFINAIHGPECVVHHEGTLYTGLHGGYLVKIKGDSITPMLTFGQPCDGFHEEEKCGRPLGMHMGKDGFLYVADAYYGIFKVNVTTNRATLLVGGDEIEGRKPSIFNGVIVADDGTVYWTDSDSNVRLHDGFYTVLADGTGRLIMYNPVTKKNSVLMDRLHLANGVTLSKDQTFLVVAETVKCRLMKYHLKGPKKGTFEVFVDALPGMPDNVKTDAAGNIYSPLVTTRDAEQTPRVVANIGRYPLLRKFAARTLKLVQNVLAAANRYYPHEYFAKAIHSVGHFEAMRRLTPEVQRVTVLKLSPKGDILESWHALDGSIESISDVEIVGNYAYLGSPFNRYLARVKLN